MVPSFGLGACSERAQGGRYPAGLQWVGSQGASWEGWGLGIGSSCKSQEHRRLGPAAASDHDSRRLARLAEAGG